jgi:hypothetical protein
MGRSVLLKRTALEDIDTVKANLQSLHDFFFEKSSSLAQTSSVSNLQISDDIVSMYSIFSNNKLERTIVSRFSALSTWLVNIYSVFASSNFKSNVGTYLQQNVFQAQSSSNSD